MERTSIYYSSNPIIALKQLSSDQIITISNRHVTVFSQKKTRVSPLQLPPAYNVVQATIHSTYISALLQSASHAFPAIFDFAGSVISDSEARALPVFYAAAENDVFTAQEENLYQYKFSAPSTEKIFTTKSKITAVNTGMFLNESCCFVGVKGKILCISSGVKMADFTFSGTPSKIVYNKFLSQLLVVGTDNQISFYNLRISMINIKNGPFLKIASNFNAKLKVSCIQATQKGYLIADENGRILNTEIQSYQMKDNKRNSQYFSILDRLPVNLFIKGYLNAFSGVVVDMDVCGDEICCCSNYVIIQSRIDQMNLIDEDISLSLGYSNDSWDLYQQIQKTFYLKSVDEFFISAEQVDQDADIKIQLKMLENAFKSLILDIYSIFKVFILSNKDAPKPFFMMAHAYSEKQDKEKFVNQFFTKVTNEPLEDIAGYPFNQFVVDHYKSVMFLFRSLQKRYKTSLDALRNLHTYLGPRLKDHKEVSQKVREMTMAQYQEWAQESLKELKEFISDKFDFEKDLVQQYNEDNYSIQQLRYFKNKIQSVTRAAVQVAENRIREKFSSSMDAMFIKFNANMPLFLVADGYGNVQKLIDVKRTQYDAILGNYDLVEQLAQADLEKPEKFMIIPGAMNRQFYYISQINLIREYNYKLFKSEQKDILNIQTELKQDRGLLKTLNYVYMQEIYDSFEMHTGQQFLIYRSFQSQASFEQTQQVIQNINKEFRGRFQLLDPYEFQQSHTDNNFFQYIFHRPRNTVRISELIQFFSQKYNVTNISNLEPKIINSPKMTQFFKTTVYGEKEIAIIIKNLLDFIIFIQKQEKLTVGLDPRRPKVHGKITPHNVFLNLDNLEISAPYLFENRTFENRNPFFATIANDVCWEAPECVLAGTHQNTDLWSVGMIAISLIYSLIYLPKLKTNARPLSMILANIGTIFTLTEEIHFQNTQILSSQKVKSDPFTAQKFVSNPQQLKLLIAVIRSQASLSTDLRALPTPEISQKISQSFLNSQNVQLTQFVLQQSIFQPVANVEQQAGSIARIFETNQQSSQCLFSLISKELQAILRAVLRFSPGARPGAEIIRKDPIFSAILESQKLKIVKWNNAINMMKAVKIQKEKKVIVNAWDEPKEYVRGVNQNKFGELINEKLNQMESQFENQILEGKRFAEIQDIFEEDEFVEENYKMKGFKYEEVVTVVKELSESSDSEPEFFINKEEFKNFYEPEISDDILIAGSGTVSEDSEDSVVSIKYAKTEQEKQAEYKAYQEQNKRKEHGQLVKESDEILKQMEELNIENDIVEEVQSDNDQIYKQEHVEEEIKENENVYYDENGQAFYFDKPQEDVVQPAVQELPVQQVQQPQEQQQHQDYQDPYAYNYGDEQHYQQQNQQYGDNYDPYGEYNYDGQEQQQQHHQEEEAPAFDPFAL